MKKKNNAVLVKITTALAYLKVFFFFSIKNVLFIKNIVRDFYLFTLLLKSMEIKETFLFGSLYPNLCYLRFHRLDDLVLTIV